MPMSPEGFAMILKHNTSHTVSHQHTCTYKQIQTEAKASGMKLQLKYFACVEELIQPCDADPYY